MDTFFSKRSLHIHGYYAMAAAAAAAKCEKPHVMTHKFKKCRNVISCTLMLLQLCITMAPFNIHIQISLMHMH